MPADVREFDPVVALVAGDGFDAYKRILAAVGGFLKPAGWIGLEVGQGQAATVRALMGKAGLTDVHVFDDLAGVSRAAFGRRLPLGG